MNSSITRCAIVGSKGVPGKNIKLLNEIPLLAYSFKSTEKFKSVNSSEYNVIINLSTDCEDIKKVASEFGIHTKYTRSEELSNDTAGKLDAIIDLAKFHQEDQDIECNYVLDVSSPSRSVENLILAFEEIKKSEAINFFLVNNAHKNAYFYMVEKNEKGFYETCKKLDKNVLSRQLVPKVFELNASFYFFKKEFIERGFKSVYSGASTIYEMKHIYFDLDEKIDFEFMKFLLVKLIQMNKKVISYPLRGYWLDVGKHEDFEKAQIDIKQVKF